jgi:hypothetical protein
MAVLRERSDVIWMQRLPIFPRNNARSLRTVPSQRRKAPAVTSVGEIGPIVVGLAADVEEGRGFVCVGGAQV